METIIYKEYGKTGKKVSVIGFGGMRFQKEDGIEKAAELVRKANELGINYFDTAPGYCDDTSEVIFGEAFKNMPNQFYVSTKHGVWNGSSADDVMRRIEKALKRMGVSKINFYHAWCITDMERYKEMTRPGGIYDGMARAKAEGLVEHVTFSTHCSGEEIEAIVKDGLFEGVTLGYNIINFPFRQIGIKAAYENGLGVATMNPLSGGLIPQKADYFDFILGAEDKTVVEAAIRFNASHKEITTVLVGLSNMEELMESVRYGEKISPLSDERLKEIENKLSGNMDKLCTSCQYCKDCPKGIPIPRYMMAYNMTLLKQSEKAGSGYIRNHWQMTNETAKECIECGNCEAACTQHLPIIERLKEIAGWKMK